MIDCYLLHRSSCIRRKALEYKYHVLKCAWPGVENLLLDVNYGMRDLAAYIVRKHSQLDVLAFYEKHLKDPDPVTAVLGIGEQGRELDDRHGLTDLVFPFLEHESEKVVRSALETAGMLMGAEGEGIYWKYLLDTRPCISLMCASGKMRYIQGPDCFTGNRKNGGDPMRLRENARIPYMSEDT